MPVKEAAVIIAFFCQQAEKKLNEPGSPE